MSLASFLCAFDSVQCLLFNTINSNFSVITLQLYYLHSHPAEVMKGVIQIFVLLLRISATSFFLVNKDFHYFNN